MARLISDILKEKEPDFSFRLAQLEKLAGSPSVDLKLVSEMTQRYKQISQELGLDQTDTTAKELFFALNKKALEDSVSLSNKLNITNKDDPYEMAEKCIKFVNKQIRGNRIWRLKSSVLKKELKNNPPKKLLKTLGLRSVDSALKREPLGKMLFFAKILEPKSWQATYINNAKKITNSDFDLQPIEITLLLKTHKLRLNLAGISSSRLVRRDQESGSLIVMSAQKRFDGDVLYLVNSLIENINKIKVNSLYLKYKSIQPNFFNIIYESRRSGLSELAGKHLDVGWEAYSKNRDSIKNREQLEEFEFDIEHEHETMAASDFIQDSVWEHPFVLQSEPNMIVSCNLSDVILNAVNGFEPEESVILHGQTELRSELFARYLAYERVVEHLRSAKEIA